MSILFNKRILLLISSILFIGTIFFLVRHDPKITNYPTAGTNIIVFGDSLAVGEGTTPGADFASLLSERFQTPILNLGVAGDTTERGLNRISDVLEQDPRIVIVLLGGNDALKKIPVEKTFTNLAQIIERIQLAGAAVILVGEPGGLYGGRYPDEYENLAQEYGVAYVPNILKGLIGRSQYMADTIHPNNAGHVIMADRIEPVLHELRQGN